MVFAQQVLLIVAFVCFALSALPQAAPNWNRLISFGLTAFIASLLVMMVPT